MTAEYTTIIDSRERNPFWTKNSKTRTVKIAKLDTGDYSIEGLTNKVCIERKSCSDLVSTLSSGHERFKKELQRALELDFFAIVVEGSFSTVKNKSFSGGFHSRMKGFVVIKILMSICVKYKIPVFLCSDRSEDKTITKELLDSYWRNRKFFIVEE